MRFSLFVASLGYTVGNDNGWLVLSLRLAARRTYVA
jgi:hypothetical protein